MHRGQSTFRGYLVVIPLVSLRVERWVMYQLIAFAMCGFVLGFFCREILIFFVVKSGVS